MTEDQTSYQYSSFSPTPTGVFGTRIPSTVTFAIGVLLFLLPFAELKCKAPKEKENGLINFGAFSTSFTNTGLGLAVGSDWKMDMPPIFNERSHDEDWKKDMKPQKPNSYAMVALILALVGLGLCFTKNKSWISVGMIAGVLAAAALIGLMIDLNNKSKDLVTETQKTGSRYIEEGTGFVLNFTPWFYITVIAMLVGAFFCFKRMKSLKT